MTAHTTDRRVDAGAPPRDRLVDELLAGSVGGSGLLEEVEATLARIAQRARADRLGCYGTSRRCPVAPGVTFKCAACATQQLDGQLSLMEIAFEVILKGVSDIFGLDRR